MNISSEAFVLGCSAIGAGLALIAGRTGICGRTGSRGSRKKSGSKRRYYLHDAFRTGSGGDNWSLRTGHRTDFIICKSADRKTLRKTAEGRPGRGRKNIWIRSSAWL